MRKNLVPLLGIAFVVAIVSTGIFYGLFVGKLRTASTASGGQAVVAVRTLERGTVIKSGDVKLAAWGGPELPKGAFTSVEQVGGLTVIDAVHENEAVLASRLASPTGGAAGLGIPAGMRAVSTRVSDSSGVINLLKPGHRVDVQLVSLPGASPELKTILQNVPVLRVDLPPDGRSNPVVTLVVAPADADAVGLGDSTARIRLSLRNPVDDSQPPLPRQTLPPLFQKAHSQKAHAAAPVRTPIRAPIRAGAGVSQ